MSPRLLERADALGLPVLRRLRPVGVRVRRGAQHARGTQAWRGRSPLPHARVSLGSDGEVCVAGATLLGYAGDPTPAPRVWPTGDLGRIDDDGYLHLTGRKPHARHLVRAQRRAGMGGERARDPAGDRAGGGVRRGAPVAGGGDRPAAQGRPRRGRRSGRGRQRRAARLRARARLDRSRRAVPRRERPSHRERPTAPRRDPCALRRATRPTLRRRRGTDDVLRRALRGHRAATASGCSPSRSSATAEPDGCGCATTSRSSPRPITT